MSMENGYLLCLDIMRGLHDKTSECNDLGYQHVGPNEKKIDKTNPVFCFSLSTPKIINRYTQKILVNTADIHKQQNAG